MFELASGVPATVRSEADLVAEGERLAARQRALDAAKARLLAEVDARHATEPVHGLRTATWWSRADGVSIAAARRRVRHSVLLHARFPDLVGALEEGRLSWGQVEVVLDAVNARTIEGFTALQNHLIRLAGIDTAPQFRADISELAGRLDADGGHRPEPADSRFHLSRTLDGTVRVDGTLVGTRADAIQAVLETHTDDVALRHRRAADSDPTLPRSTRSHHRAQALEELLLAVAEVEVHVVAPAGEPARHLDGTPLARHTTDQLEALGDRWRTITIDDDGLPLSVGRSTRTPTIAQRAALWARDGGCAFPGCVAPPRYCDGHHVAEWADGGLTDLENLALLCRFHHRLVHDTDVHRRWLLHLDVRERATFRDPRGREHPGQRHHRVPPRE